MLKIMYTIKPEEVADEVIWLKGQKIFPAVEEYYDWVAEGVRVHVGVIVNNETAMMIKLRHGHGNYQDYKQR